MNAIQLEPEIITRKGKPVSVILPLKTYEDLLERMEDAEDTAWLRRARKTPLHYRPMKNLLKPFARPVGQVIEDQQALPGKLSRFGAPDRIDRLMEVGFHMETVEEVPRVRQEFACGLEVGPPSVAAHSPDVQTPRLTLLF